ncbi:MAG: desulfoferrodoxin Dfx domain-containing protein [Desulfohalobiaceae bacterium]
MPQEGEFFRFTNCGNVLKVKQAGEENLFCCGMIIDNLTEREAAEFKGD